LCLLRWPYVQELSEGSLCIVESSFSGIGINRVRKVLFLYLGYMSGFPLLWLTCYYSQPVDCYPLRDFQLLFSSTNILCVSPGVTFALGRTNRCTQWREADASRHEWARRSTERMNLKRPTHILAVISIGVGAWWSCITLFYPISRIWTTGASDPIQWLGLFVIPMMIIPGAIALLCGIGLLKEVTKERIKGSVGALAIFGTFWTAVYVDKFFLPENSNMLSLLIALAIIILLYVLISKRLFKSTSIPQGWVVEVKSGWLWLVSDQGNRCE